MVLIISSLADQKLWASINSRPKIGNQQDFLFETALKIKLILLNHLNAGNHYEK